MSKTFSGKLVPQDPNDQPDEVLLRKIHEDSKKLVFEKEDLPNGWVSTTVGMLYRIIGGGTPPTKVENYWQGNIPWITSADIHGLYDIRPRRYVTDNAVKNSPTNLVPEDSIIIVTRVGLGKIAFTKSPICFSQDSQALLGNKLIVYSHYALYFLSQVIQIFKYVNRGTTISGVTKKQLSELPFSLPPLNEQKRIVQKIESILSQIDAAQSRLEVLASQVKSPPGSLSMLKNSVLEQAFEEKCNFETTEMGNLILFSKNGFTGRPNKDKKGNPRLGIESITNSNSIFINEDKCKFIDISKSKEKNYETKKGDLFFCRQNGNKNNVGKCKVLRNTIKSMIFSDSLIQFRLNDKIVPEYVVYFTAITSSRNQIEQCCFTTAGNFSINGTNLKKVLVKFPAVSQQKRIVSKIESILGRIDAIEKQVDDSLIKLDQLKKAVLKKAFEGKLVPQDPNDEPASILLEKIKQEKHSRVKKRK